MLNVFQNKRAQILYKAILFIKWHAVFLIIYYALARDSGKLTVPSIRDTMSQTFMGCKSAQRPTAIPL